MNFIEQLERKKKLIETLTGLKWIYWAVKQLSDATWLSQSIISNFINWKREPSRPEVLNKLFNYFNI